MPRKAATTLSPNIFQPAPRPPFPGVESVSSYCRRHSRTGYAGIDCNDEGFTEVGFPDPGYRTPHDPVVHLSSMMAVAIFSGRQWPCYPTAPWHQPRAELQRTGNLTDADFYPGLERDELMQAWFKEVALAAGWKDVLFHGRSVTLVSKLA